MKSYLFLISGRVQGVWYRATVQKNAQSAGFSGYVRNLPDSRVEAGVTCRVEELSLFRELLREGSKLSYVDHIEQEETDEIFNGAFIVRQ